jgi:hypothetical protein
MRRFHVRAIRTPTIVNRGALTYFFDGDGNRWRVYDSADEPHHGRPFRQVIPLGDPLATVRCFAPLDKTAAHYVYTFQSDGDRDVTIECLTAQLRAARQFYRRLYNVSTGKQK